MKNVVIVYSFIPYNILGKHVYIIILTSMTTVLALQIVHMRGLFSGKYIATYLSTETATTNQDDKKLPQ